MESDFEDIIRKAENLLTSKGGRIVEELQRELSEIKFKDRRLQEAFTLYINRYTDLTRPTLLTLVCEALDVDPQFVSPLAKGLTLIGGGIDLHDDIIDNSREKMGAETLYGKYGLELTLLMGDALFMKGFTYLYKLVEYGIEPKRACSSIETLLQYYYELGEAEVLETNLRGRFDVDIEEYLRILRMKAADVEGYIVATLVLLDAPKQYFETLGQYGRTLGLMDILKGEIGDTVFPQELKNRLMNETIPLPILYAVEESSELVKRLRNIKTADLERLLPEIEKLGGFHKTVSLMSEMINKTLNELEKINIKNREELEILLLSLMPPQP